MRRVAVAVIPRPAAATAASTIALGAVSPVFASLPGLPLLAFACLVELGVVPLPVAGELAGDVLPGQGLQKCNEMSHNLLFR